MGPRPTAAPSAKKTFASDISFPPPDSRLAELQRVPYSHICSLRCGGGVGGQFGPHIGPVGWAHGLAGHGAGAHALNGRSQLGRTGPVAVHDVAQVPQRGFAVRCKPFTGLRIHARQVMFEVHASITAFDVFVSQ